ncbi:MAG: tetratricopeptide repeat protein [Meiothermus sp.]|nr:tetratricopeptide repeat protein [Meiothermus sp.]
MLGVLEVWLGSRRLSFRTRKEQALLVYLALEPGPHPRDKLVALLWPESDQAKGRANLRMVLARLRDDLGEASPLVQVQGDSVGLQRQHLELDLWRLEAALAGGGPEPSPDQRLGSAARLWRGEVLEGFDLGDAPEFEDWLLVQRETARSRLDALMERQAAVQRDGGRLEAALETAQRRLRLEPLNEAAHRQVIELHLAAENRPAALEAFNLCARVLHSELGLQPDAHTQSLLGRIHSPQAATVTVAPPVLEPTRLFGREGEWARMEAAWRAGQAVVLHGVSGVGKSRLMTEFAAGKGRFLHWEGRPGDALIPYGTHARTFRPLCEALGGGLPGWVRAELARIVPGLGGAPPPITSDAERLRFLEAKAEALQLYFAQGAAALVYDDLQFADNASLEAAWYVLNKLLPAGPNGPRAILGFRTGELSGPFLHTLQQAVDAGLAVMIEVRPLEAQAVAQMLRDLELSDQLGPSLHRFTGGNPLFVLETVRSLGERGGLETLTPERFENRCRVAGLGRTPRVQAIIEHRLERLSVPAQDLTRVAAVLGEYFSLELGAKVLGASVPETARLGAELETAQVLRKGRFSHDLILETVLENIPESLLPLLHAQVLEALEGRSIPGAVRLRHALGAESAPALSAHALAAAEEASKLYAHEDIFALLEQAAAFFERSGLRAQAASVLTALARATALTGRMVHSLEAHQRALRLYGDLGDVGSLAQVHLQLSLLHRALGQLEPAQRYAELALNHYRQTDDLPHLARALWRLGEAHWWQRQFERAWDCLTEAHRLGRLAGDAEVVAWVLKDLGQTAYFLGDHAQAVAFLEQSVEQAQALNDKIALGWTHFDLARLLLVLGRLEPATLHHRAALELFEQSGHMTGIQAARVELGHLAALEGRLEEARGALARSHQTLLEIQGNDTQSDLLMAVADLLAAQGRSQPAAELVSYVQSQPLKDNPFAHVRARQLQSLLEQTLPPAALAQAKAQAPHRDLRQIATLLETL